MGGQKFVFDCNITNDNEDDVLEYVESIIGYGRILDAFICSHRDADHMRGVKKLHNYFPIKSIWDSGWPGTTTDTSEYRQYMDLRRQVGSKEINKVTRDHFGDTRFRYLSAKDQRLSHNANAQGIVIKVEHLYRNACASSVMLTGDCDAETWRRAIMIDYQRGDLSSSILMAAHHGSISFFDDPLDSQYYFTDHMRAINPEMTIVSVGDNPHGHPDRKAMELYEKFTRGSRQGNKVFTTQGKGTMRLTLKNEGWSLNVA